MTRNTGFRISAAIIFASFAASASAVTIIGLSKDKVLGSYDSSVDSNFHAIGALSGFTNGDRTMVGIDFRIQDGLLYGVGNNGGVYTIDTTTAAMTFVGTLSVALDGTAFGVDFNPVANRLRIVSDTGQNLRHDVVTGITLVDDALDYAPGTPLNTSGPTATGITDAAYTNNDLDVLTGTTLFVVDSNLDQIAIQSPPNNGSLAFVGKLTVGVGAITGFDILSSVSGTATTVNTGYFAADNGKGLGSTVYSLNLLTGQASPVILNSRFRGIDIALPLGQ